MGRLLLRSTKSEQFDTRIDVLFQNVQALQFPSLLSGLVIAAADSAAAERITKATGLLPDDESTLPATTPTPLDATSEPVGGPRPAGHSIRTS